MNNKKYTLIVVLLTIIATTLVFGAIYQLTKQTKTVVNNEVSPVLESGKTILINENYKPWKCSPNGEPCEKILVTTEIDLTKSSDGNQLTGKFYIRAYNGADYKNSPKIGELQITQNFNPFANNTESSNNSKGEILTINASKKTPVFDETKFKDKFYLEYMTSVPGWGSPGYVLRLDNVGENSDFSGRFVDFYYSNGRLNISTPQ